MIEKKNFNVDTNTKTYLEKIETENDCYRKIKSLRFQRNFFCIKRLIYYYYYCYNKLLNGYFYEFILSSFFLEI